MSLSKVASLATLLALAIASPATQESAVLRLKLDPGMTVKFKTVTVANTEGFIQAQNTITVEQSVKVLSQSEGWTSVRFSNEEVKFEGTVPFGSKDLVIGGMKQATIKLEVDELGATRNMVLENADKLDPTARQIYEGTEKSAQITGFMGVSFPKGQLTTGTTWAIELDGAKMFEKTSVIKSASGKLPVKFEVLGFEDLGGKRMVKIKTTLSGTINIEVDAGGTTIQGSNEMTGETTSWIDVATGILQKSTGTATVVSAFDVGTQTQKLTVTVERTG